MTPTQADKARRGDRPMWQRLFRRLQARPCLPMWLIYKLLFKAARFACHVDLSEKTSIGPGLYVNHPYGITINSRAVIGSNCNLTKGVTIGQENRGPRRGAPVIGDRVWIGMNSTVVGAVTIGDDVLIAPNTLVNRDVPPHSVVIGCPCSIHPRQNATEGYINNLA